MRSGLLQQSRLLASWGTTRLRIILTSHPRSVGSHSRQADSMLHASSREKPQNRRRILSAWPRCGHSQPVPSQNGISVRDSSTRRQFDIIFFSPVSRRPSVFGHRSPASGSECPIAAFPVPWGDSFRGVIGSGPFAGCRADFGRRTRSGVDSYVSLFCVHAGGFLPYPMT